MFITFFRIFSLLIVGFLLFGCIAFVIEILESSDQFKRLKDFFWFSILFLIGSVLILWYIIQIGRIVRDKSNLHDLIDVQSLQSSENDFPSPIIFITLSVLQALVGLGCMAMFLILLRNVARMNELNTYNVIPLLINSIIVFYGILTEIVVIKMLILYLRKQKAIRTAKAIHSSGRS